MAGEAHGPPAQAVRPFVALPRAREPLAIQFGQPGELLRGAVVAAGGDQRGHVEAADERPDAAVVVVVGLVEVTQEEVIAPVGIAGPDGVVEGAYSVRRVQAAW